MGGEKPAPHHTFDVDKEERCMTAINYSSAMSNPRKVNLSPQKRDVFSAQGHTVARTKINDMS